MSNIIFNNIDVTFPIAGQDNPSKGFRDNWSYIQQALQVAKSEITKLETTALLKHSLTSTDSVQNDLGQSTIINGSYKEFYGSSHTTTPGATDTTITINVANGDVQQINLVHTAVTVLFSGWPADTQYGKVRLHLTTASVTALSVLDFTAPAALSIKFDELFPEPFIVNTDEHAVVEAWSFDNGETVFIKYLGTFVPKT